MQWLFWVIEGRNNIILKKGDVERTNEETWVDKIKERQCDANTGDSGSTFTYSCNLVGVCIVFCAVAKWTSPSV